jgi:hypothetical protein
MIGGNAWHVYDPLEKSSMYAGLGIQLPTNQSCSLSNVRIHDCSCSFSLESTPESSLESDVELTVHSRPQDPHQPISSSLL